jgi:hypothetical protein
LSGRPKSASADRDWSAVRDRGRNQIFFIASPDLTPKVLIVLAQTVTPATALAAPA